MRILAALAVLLASSVASAQAPGQTYSLDFASPAPPERITINYRSHVLLADGLSVAAIALGGIAENETLLGVGFWGYLGGAPIVHLAHGRGGTAVSSLALRVGLPLAAGYLGYQLGPTDVVCAATVDPEYPGHAHGCEGGSFRGLLVGMLGGAAAAIVIDARHLAKYEKTVTTWSAGITRTNGGAMLGIGRAF